MARRSTRARSDERDTFDAFAVTTAQQFIVRLGDVLDRLTALSVRLPAGQNAGLAAELFTATERLDALCGYLECLAQPSAGQPAAASAEQPVDINPGGMSSY